MLSFADVMTRLSEEEKIKALSSILEYTTIESLIKDYDSPVIETKTMECDFDASIDSLKINSTLQHMKEVEEIEIVLHNIKSLDRSMRLDHFENANVP